MAERNYYVIRDDGCKFPSMTKQQIYALLDETISSGHLPTDYQSGGFVTQIKEKNRNTDLSFWVGTQAEYNALDPKPQNTFCIISDDTSRDEFISRIEELMKLSDSLKVAVDGLKSYKLLMLEQDSTFKTLDVGDLINLPFNSAGKYILYAYNSIISAKAELEVVYEPVNQYYMTIKINKIIWDPAINLSTTSVESIAYLVNHTGEMIYYKLIKR